MNGRVNVSAIFAIAAIFILLCQLMIFAVAPDPWLDASFSIETAHKLNAEGWTAVNWAQYDVHPPLYYLTLAGWMRLNPGMSELNWGKELSVVFGTIFVILVAVLLSELFGATGLIAAYLLSMGSVYLHFATEVRMYAMLLALSALVAYALLVKGEERGWWLVAGLSLAIMPWIQYISSAIAAAVFLVIAAFYVNKRWKLAIIAALVAVSGLIALFTMALPQMARTDGSFFQPCSQYDIFGAAAFSFHIIDGMNTPNWLIVCAYVCAMLLIGVLVWWIMSSWKTIEWSAESQAMMFMLGSWLIVVVYGLALFILVNAGFDVGRLYHHRFFLVVLWMFAAATLVFMLKKWGVWAFVAILLVQVLMLGAYGATQHHELQELMAGTPCENITVVHESTFSAIPYQYEARNRGCAWENYISTGLSERRLNGGGGDAMLEGHIWYNETWPDVREYYVVNATGMAAAQQQCKVIVQSDGVNLLKCSRV